LPSSTRHWRKKTTSMNVETMQFSSPKDVKSLGPVGCHHF
jgi:hypothetical protein